MLKTIRFPIKGSFYYDAAQAFAKGELSPPASLKLLPDPQNAYDVHALQIWHDEALLGYVPRHLAKALAAHFPARFEKMDLVKAEQHRHFLWLECQLTYHCSFWQHLKLLLLSARVRWHYRLKLQLTFLKRPHHDP